MHKRKVKLLIVCEDVQQSAFARRYFKKCGFHSRRIRVRHNPAGAGSGEQFVRQRLVHEVKLYRQKSSYGHGGIALVAIIDADTMSVQERLEQINSALEQERIERIEQNEKIAIFIPKRNIETWIRFATDSNVNEDINYPKLKKIRSCKHEVDLYINKICRDGVPHDAPSSLVHACDELRKIL